MTVTYAQLALLFLGLAGVVTAAAVAVARPSRRWWACTAAVLGALLVLTAVFDSLMIGADLFRFDDRRLLGAHVLLAPVEDFAWPVAAALGLPAIWAAMGRRRVGEERS